MTTILSKEEVALARKVSVSTIDRWIRGGGLRTVKVGKRVWITEQALDEFFRRQELVQTQQ